MKTAFFVTCPHSGEKVAPETKWLHKLPESILFCDADRYVDQFYINKCRELRIPFIKTEWNRYVVDLNRSDDDIDPEQVIGASPREKIAASGLYWTKTTQGDVLLSEPITMELHQELVRKYHRPFHQAVEEKYQEFFQTGYKTIYQLDAHSMPSKGTEAHRDPGETRAEIVISDFKGKSCSREFMDLAISSYREAGFEVRENWPYFGGGVTQRYGKPAQGQHCLQVEISRGLYMDEVTKKPLPVFDEVRRRIESALEKIHSGLKRLK